MPGGPEGDLPDRTDANTHTDTWANAHAEPDTWADADADPDTDADSDADSLRRADDFVQRQPAERSAAADGRVQRDVHWYSADLVMDLR